MRSCRVRGTTAGGDAPPRRAAADGVPRVRLRRHRGHQRHRPQDPQGRRQALQPREAGGGQPAHRHGRHRSHPLGHPRRPHHPERASPHRPVGADRPHPQRHHRERRRDPQGAPQARTHLHVRDRHRGAGAPGRRALPGQPRGGRRRRAPRGGGGVRHRGDLRGRARRPGGGAERLPPHRGHRRGRALRGVRRLAPAGPHPLRGVPRRRRDGHPDPRRLPGPRPGRQADRQAGQPDRLGPGHDRARRLRALHAQGDLRAAGDRWATPSAGTCSRTRGRPA